MDSGNSGSISSSGDEEYESRSDLHSNQPIPSFLMNPSSLIATTHFGSNSNNPPTHHLLSPNNNNSNIFDNHNTNTFFLNLDTARSALMRSDHHNQQPPPPPYSHLRASASSLPIHHSIGLSSHSQFPGQSQQQPSQLPNETVMTTSTSTTTTTANASAGGGGGGSSSQPTPARASKKRTRASRRAPTTVLTTDTSNFRAMVQEFTGIPAPPFSANSPFSRRFDLFGRSSALEGPLYPHLVRPSAIKPQSSIAASTLPTSYGGPSDHHQGLMRMNMANVMQQNQGLNMGFQLQFLPSLHLDSGSGASQTSLALDQQQLSFGTTSNRVSSDGSIQMNTNVWRGEGAGSGGDVGCKMNFPAAVGTNTSEFNGEKGGLEINVASSRGTEGTVDSWIFPSD